MLFGRFLALPSEKTLLYDRNHFSHHTPVISFSRAGSFLAKEEEKMRVSEKMKVKDALALGEHMLDVFVWLAPEFERLKYPKLRRAMAGRVTVSQAARIARVPLAEALYVLNLAAGCDSNDLSSELRFYGRRAFQYCETNPPLKPKEIMNLGDADPRITFVDVTPEADKHLDPMPKLAKGLVSLREQTDVLLVRHPFDPIPLRDMLARRGYASWAEERRPGDWYIYFYRPAADASAIVCPAVTHEAYVMAAGGGI